MVSKYPLIEALGVKVFPSSGGVPGYDFVSAADLEAALAKAPIVYGQQNKYEVFEWGQYSDEQIKIEGPGITDTHTARLLCIQPIAKDTAESLLRELAQYSEHGGVVAAPHGWLERARKLLEGKNG